MVDRRIKIRHLEAFVEIARERRLKTAAEKLALTSPSISKTLKELEEILGTTLMTRDRSGVALTPHGTVFLGSAKSALASLQQGVDGVDRLKQHQLETLQVGALPSVAAWLMPLVAQELSQNEPGLRLRIVDGPHDYLLEQLALGKIDHVIGRFSDPDRMAAVAFTHLYSEHVDLVVRAGHPLLDQPSLDAVARYPVIFPPKGAAIRQLVDRFLMTHGVTDLPNRLETVSGAFGRVYTQKSDAVWFISRGVVMNEIADGRLVRLPIDTSETKGAVGLMTRVNWAPTPASALFRKAIESVLNA